MSDDTRFELDLELPNREVSDRTSRLVSFEARYVRVHADLQMLLSPEALEKWSQKAHHRVLPVCAVLQDRYPLVVFHGDVGTGKTAVAEGIADQLARDLHREGRLLKLSTRVRGRGLHGEMSRLIGEAFDEVVKAAGRERLAVLIIDEADALAASREGSQLHQEEKAGTNTLIQRIDDIRRLRGRVLVILCTNRLHALDPAIVRRAARVEEFARPDDAERRELLQQDLEGLELTEEQIETLVGATGPHEHGGLGLTFSDLRTRWLPAAVAAVFPKSPLTFAVLKSIAQATPPSPAIVDATSSHSPARSGKNHGH